MPLKYNPGSLNRTYFILLVSFILVGITVQPCLAWQGAKVLEIKHPQTMPYKRFIQVPVEYYQPAGIDVDSNGQIFIHQLNGHIYRYQPYIGLTGHWFLPAGVEAQSISTDDHQYYAIDRNGVLHQFNVDVSTTTLPQKKSWKANEISPAYPTRVTDELPQPHGYPCYAGNDIFAWPDIYGGVFLASPEGDIINQFSGAVLRQKQLRGGAVVACLGSNATTNLVIALSGGKIIGLHGEEVQWSIEDAQLKPFSFAPHAAMIDENRVFLCAYEHQCFVLSTKDGQKLVTLPFGSQDGPSKVSATHWVITDSHGQLHVLDEHFKIESTIVVGKGPLWLLRPSTAEAEAPDLPPILWATNSHGELFRIDMMKGLAKAVYKVLPGFSSGGVILQNRLGIVQSNSSSIYFFELR